MVKRRVFRKRKVVRRRRRTRGVNNPRANMYMFKRTCALTNTANIDSKVSLTNAGQLTIVSGNDAWVLDTGGLGVTNVNYYSVGVFFTLDMLPNYTEFSALFDQYMISRVKVKLTPFSTGANLSQSTTVGNNQTMSCLVHSCLDYDDYTSSPASATGIDELRQYDNYKTQNLFDQRKGSVSRYFKPHVATAGYAGAFTGYINKGPQWIDAATVNIKLLLVLSICNHLYLMLD